MPEHSKAVKRQLRVLSEMAHEAELRHALTDLAVQFDRWQKGDLDSFQLTEEIHKFHHGPSRKLYNYYAAPPFGFEEMKIAHAVVAGFLPREKIPPELAPIIDQHVALIQRHASDTDSDANADANDESPA